MRLFIAVNFPVDLRRGIWDASAPLRAAGWPVRWVEQEALHLTLKFLGSADPGTVPAIVAVLEDATLGTRAFGLPLGGFGAFPTVERARVIWVGCEGVPALELLQHRLEVGMDALGFPIEGQPFRPHVTLGRVKKSAPPGSTQGLARLVEELDYHGASPVGSVELMESTQGPGGSQYRSVHSAALHE